MKLFPLQSDRVSLGVTETGGHLSDAVFSLDGERDIRPMHTAPWEHEALPEDTPPILKILRGDFFCAPFGTSDILPGGLPVHGLPASGTWRATEADAASLTAVLDGDVMGATVTKQVTVRPGEAVVYQRHTLAGGDGRLPVGHHAMLSAKTPLQLAYSPWITALTPPEPVEEPPHGRALLAEGQVITDFHHARRADGGTVDLTVFPTAEDYEQIWMIVADRTRPFAWTAATAAEEGWVWFALKDPRVLPQTLMWLSNGGRDYAPWNGRHRRAIGLEEICGYFHLSHSRSIGDNPVAESGSPTAITLDPNGTVAISYMFGVAAVSPGFGRVADITATPGGVTLHDADGNAVFAPCDPTFVSGNDPS